MEWHCIVITEVPLKLLTVSVVALILKVPMIYKYFSADIL